MFNNLLRKYYTYGAVPLNPGSGGANIFVDVVGVDSVEVVKQAFGTEGVVTPVNAANPLPVTDAVVVAKLDIIITLLSSFTFIEVAATFAAIGVSTATRLVYVTADETNNNDITLYIYVNGQGLKFLQTVA